MNSTTNGAKSRHSMPACFVLLLEKLLDHESIEKVGSGSFTFHARNSEGNHIKIQTVDPQRRYVHFVAHCNDALQHFYVTVKEGVENTAAVGQFLNSYYSE